MKLYIEATRPKTWIASISPILIGTLLAPKIDWFVFLVTLTCGICIQIGTNLANDYYDFIQNKDTPLRKGPRRLCQSGLISKDKMFWMMVISFSTSIAFSGYLIWKGGMIILAMMLLAIFLGVFYTKGPISYAYKGISEPVVLFCLGSLAVFFTYYLQTQQFELKMLYFGLAPGFFSVALLAANNLRDFEEDTVTGKNTLVVIYGKLFGKLEIASALIFPFLIIYNSWNFVLVPFVVFILIKLFHDEEPQKLLGKIAFCYIIFTINYFVLHFKV